MKFNDVYRWATMAAAAIAILPLAAASALARSSAPGAGDTFLPAANAQSIDRVACGSHAGGIVLAGDEEMYSDDDGQPPEMDDPGTDNPPGTDDDDDGDDSYTVANEGLADGPGWCCRTGLS